MSPTAWAAAFLTIAALTVMALAIFLMMRPHALAGDRG
jgi:hypothetical protein